MAFKIVILCAALAVANAGFLGAPAAYGAYGVAPALAYGAAPSNYAYGGAVGASHQSTLRSLDGNQVVSQYSKSVNTPFSSVSKTDTRVTNDAVAYAHAPAVAAYAAPAYHGAYAAPAVAAYAAPAYHGAYAAPAIRAYAAPAVAAYGAAYHGAAYATPAVSAYGAAYHGAAYAAPAVAAYAAPAYHGAAYATPAVSAYGAAYAPAYHGGVSHISFDGIGAHYAY